MPQSLENGGIGEPCGADGNCATGLKCRTLYVVPGYDSPSFTANACTVGCDAGCPGNAVCASELAVCLRACVTDSDCRAGISAGVCDGGRCDRLQCTGDQQCPGGFACEIPAVVCCPRGGCAFEGKVPGYCRKS